MRKLDLVALITFIAFLFTEILFIYKSLDIGKLGERYSYASSIIFLLLAFLTGIWLVAREL